MAKSTHIAVISSPGFSHLVPIVEFTKQLVSHHPNFQVNCIIPSLGSPPESSKSYLETLPPFINPIFLPPINREHLPKRAPPGVLIQQTITISLPSIHEALKTLTSKAPLIALVADPFVIQALEFAKELNSLSYLYFPCSATVLSVILHMEKLDEEVSGEYRDLKEPIKLPGCVQLMGSDLPTPTQDRSSEGYKQFLERCKMFSVAADGILINTFLEMESGAIRALGEDWNGKIKVYPVGPITQIRSKFEANGNECLKWLENQPPNSVVYVSFGSGGTLTQHQINELALGLELSTVRFLWVLRAPSDTVNAAYLEAGNEDPLQFLPSGFLERTKEPGLVVPSWAPQVQVLAHDSVGGFLSHCGWNSILESMQEGVPIIAWPLFAEQRVNEVMLADGLKVALRVKFNEDGVVKKDEFAKVLKTLMEAEEGDAMRKRMRDFKVYATDAIKDGSSTQTMIKVASQWENLGGV